jgi:hypothetical protein
LLQSFEKKTRTHTHTYIRVCNVYTKRKIHAKSSAKIFLKLSALRYFCEEYSSKSAGIEPQYPHEHSTRTRSFIRKLHFAKIWQGKCLRKFQFFFSLEGDGRIILKYILRRMIWSKTLDIVGSRWFQIAGCCISGSHPSDCTYTYVLHLTSAHMLLRRAKTLGGRTKTFVQCNNVS